MQECFKTEPSERPSFKSLATKLTTLTDKAENYAESIDVDTFAETPDQFLLRAETPEIVVQPAEDSINMAYYNASIADYIDVIDGSLDIEVTSV